METKNKKCAHPSCNCIAETDSDYCSTYCEGQAETPDVVCGCGHAACVSHSKLEINADPRASRGTL